MAIDPDVDNARARRAYEKAGFRGDAEFRTSVSGMRYFTDLALLKNTIGQTITLVCPRRLF